ncbi:hypothetical protein CKO15_03985 [Halorhodospira abdelmalekii]|uniref:CHASE2 domain-containing protein n=1 Tax=Halorhodospira abdelmalekii TaxID=421629 RepID=UPI0019086F6F|nr:adenylate/guanylate cyclase domain-containing protein [Halorhodospira abdelmalekii]MBK1734458.1 hypothetical protein [Halorhodospira abdelmalekii]
MLARLRARLTPLSLGMVVLAVTLVAIHTEREPLYSAVVAAQNFFYDQRLNWTQPGPPDDPQVVIVDIDERSLSAVGRWPWPRERVADLVAAIQEAGAAVVAFDVVFAEAERNIAERVAQAVGDDADAAMRQRIESLMPAFDGDRRLAEQLARGDSVLGYILHSDVTGEHDGVLPEPLHPSLTIDGLPLSVLQMPAYTGNRRQFQEAAHGAGFFTVLADGDGVVRRVPMVLAYNGALYSALSVEAVRELHLLPALQLDTAPLGQRLTLEGVRLGSLYIPTDHQGQVLVPFQGPRGSFPYISAADLLSPEVDSPRSLEGSIALLGTSALGLYDIRPTPLDRAMPGVEVHANIIHAMLEGSFPRRPAWVEGADLVSAIALGAVAVLALPFLSPWLGLILAALLIAGFTAWNLWAWVELELALGYVSVVAGVVAVTATNFIWGFAFEHRRRNQLRQRFGEYVPPQLVEQMAENPAAYSQEGENREITLLFCDIRGFTTLSEKLDAADVKAVLNRFFTPMTRIIFEHHGTIDKYVGDMIMAFWGAPMDDPDQRRHAVQAALAMLEEVDRLKVVFRAEGLPEIDIGIGLNTGLANVGDMGSDYRRAYTAIGDAVNLAARIESLTKEYGSRLLISEHTRAGIETEWPLIEVDRVQVKGRKEPVTLYRVDL